MKKHTKYNQGLNETHSSKSSLSVQSLKQIINTDQIHNTLDLIHNMKSTINEWETTQASFRKSVFKQNYLKQNELRGKSFLKTSFRKISQSPITHYQTLISLSHDRFKKYQMEHKDGESEDDYLMKEIINGKKANINFLEKKKIHILDEQNYFDQQDYQGMQEEISRHYETKFTKYNQLVYKAEYSLSKQKLDKILWMKNEHILPNQYFNRRQDLVIQKKSKYRRKKNDESDEESEKKVEPKNKVEQYLQKKFNNGFSKDSLSKTVKLKPVRLLIKTEESEEKYKFKELKNKQMLIFKKHGIQNMSRQNRNYLLTDFKQIQKYLKESLQ